MVVVVVVVSDGGDVSGSGDGSDITDRECFEYLRTKPCTVHVRSGGGGGRLKVPASCV